MTLEYYAAVYRNVTLLARSFITAQNDAIALYPNVDKNKDARVTAFSRCTNVCISTSMGLAVYLKHVSNDTWWQTEMQPGIDQLHVEVIRNEFVQFQKLGFVHFSYAAIESALRIFNKTVDPKFSDEKFKNVYDNLLRKLRMRRYGCLLDLLRLLRNTLHTNGYHNANDEIITYKSKTYRFVRGQMPQFFEWSFLAGLMYDVKDVLLEMVKSNQIANESHIDDPFAIPYYKTI